MNILPGKAFLSLLLATAVAVGMATTAFAKDLPEGDARINVINQAELSPTAPRSEALDAYLQELLDSILEDDMDTYQQVKACYDYLVDNLTYGSHTARLGTLVSDGVSCNSIYSKYGEVEGFGAVALTSGTGMCNAYSSAFILMVQEIGLDARLVQGYTRSAGGGYAYHKWAEVNIDGTVYVFDPQLEQNLRSAGMATYSVFCKTYEQVGSRYSL